MGLPVPINLPSFQILWDKYFIMKTLSDATKKLVRWLQPKFSQDDVLKRTRNGKKNLVSDLISSRREPNHVSEVLQPWRVFNKDQVQTAVCQVGTGRQTLRTLGACAGDVRSDHTDEAPFDGMPTWEDIYDEDILSGTKLISKQKSQNNNSLT